MSAGSAQEGQAGTGGTAVTGGGGMTADSGGSGSAGSANGGTSTGCTGVPMWMLTTYSAGARVQSGNNIYQCKTFPQTGWCGKSDAYAPTSGRAWADAWDLVGPCP